MRKKVLLSTACLAIVLVAACLWMHRWIDREALQCVRWRFTAHNGKSFHDEIWFPRGGYESPAPWEGRISGLSGQLDVFIPVQDDLPWHRKLLQNFRLERRITYRKGLIHGSIVHLDGEGHEISIQQYRDGKEDGISCYFNSDGSFSHLVSFKNGVMDGPRISCWTNGLLSSADLCLKDGRNGPAREWWPTGELRQEGSFGADKYIGKHTFWYHHNGAKSHEIEYSAQGVPMHTTIWAADGKCIGTGTYKEGRPWDGYFAASAKGHVYLGYYSGGQSLRHAFEWPNETTKH